MSPEDARRRVMVVMGGGWGGGGGRVGALPAVVGAACRFEAAFVMLIGTRRVSNTTRSYYDSLPIAKPGTFMRQQRLATQRDLLR